MNKKLRKFALLLAVSFAFSACGKTETAEGFDTLIFSDDTTAAAELVQSANEDLNKIKVMYKKNEVQREELIAAINEKNIEKVKTITDDLVNAINEGTILGESAVKKIGEAERMDINPEFKEYLGLKEESLQKQLEAFENRRQAARILRDSFGTADPSAVEKAIISFKEKEATCLQILETSKEINKKANDYAKRSASQTN